MVFPETDVICNEQVGPWHLDGAYHRIELVILDGGAAAKRRLNRTRIGGRRSTPPNGIQERVKPLRGIEPVRPRKIRLWIRDTGAGLHLPDDLQLLAKSVIRNAIERN